MSELKAPVRIFRTNERVNQILIEHLDTGIWRAQPPGKVRTIAAILSHMHHVRVKWVRLTAPEVGIPALLSRAGCTMEEVRAALAESGDRCVQMLEAVVDGAAREFRRDGWAAGWPAGPEMLAYMIAHEAHHRGQICMLAHQLGSPLGPEVTSAMWNWERIWRDGEF